MIFHANACITCFVHHLWIPPTTFFVNAQKYCYHSSRMGKCSPVATIFSLCVAFLLYHHILFPGPEWAIARPLLKSDWINWRRPFLLSRNCRSSSHGQLSITHLKPWGSSDRYVLAKNRGISHCVRWFCSLPLHHVLSLYFLFPRIITNLSPWLNSDRN